MIESLGSYGYGVASVAGWDPKRQILRRACAAMPLWHFSPVGRKIVVSRVDASIYDDRKSQRKLGIVLILGEG